MDIKFILSGIILFISGLLLYIIQHISSCPTPTTRATTIPTTVAPTPTTQATTIPTTIAPTPTTQATTKPTTVAPTPTTQATTKPTTVAPTPTPVDKLNSYECKKCTEIDFPIDKTKDINTVMAQTMAQITNCMDKCA